MSLNWKTTRNAWESDMSAMASTADGSVLVGLITGEVYEYSYASQSWNQLMYCPVPADGNAPMALMIQEDLDGTPILYVVKNCGTGGMMIWAYNMKTASYDDSYQYKAGYPDAVISTWANLITIGFSDGSVLQQTTSATNNWAFIREADKVNDSVSIDNLINGPDDTIAIGLSNNYAYYYAPYTGEWTAIFDDNNVPDGSLDLMAAADNGTIILGFQAASYSEPSCIYVYHLDTKAIDTHNHSFFEGSVSALNTTQVNIGSSDSEVIDNVIYAGFSSGALWYYSTVLNLWYPIPPVANSQSPSVSQLLVTADMTLIAGFDNGQICQWDITNKYSPSTLREADGNITELIISSSDYLIAGITDRLVAEAVLAAGETWMNDSINLIGSKSLSEICIPGSHNSGTYEINFNTFGYVVSECNIICQTLDMLGQLNVGCRFFDIRPYIATLKNRTTQFYTGHFTIALGFPFGAVTASLSDIIDQLNTFQQGKREVIILHISPQINLDTKNDFTPAELQTLCDTLSTIDNLYQVTTTKPFATPINTILSSGSGNTCQVIVIVETNSSTVCNGTCFARKSQANYYSKYSNSNDLDFMIADQFDKMNGAHPNDYFVLNWTLTQDQNQALGCSFNNYFWSTETIIDLAAEANSSYAQIIDKIKADPTVFPNVLYVDNINNDTLSTVQQINQMVA